jgi:hypothetical protein
VTRPLLALYLGVVLQAGGAERTLTITDCTCRGFPPDLTSDQRRDIRARLASILYLHHEPGVLSHGIGSHPGNPNMPTARFFPGVAYHFHGFRILPSLASLSSDSVFDDCRTDLDYIINLLSAPDVSQDGRLWYAGWADDPCTSRTPDRPQFALAFGVLAGNHNVAISEWQFPALPPVPPTATVKF